MNHATWSMHRSVLSRYRDYARSARLRQAREDKEYENAICTREIRASGTDFFFFNREFIAFARYSATEMRM